MIRRLFVPDCHWPDVDPIAFGTMMAFAKDFRPHEVYVLGDYWDCFCVSSFDKDPDRLRSSLDEEISTGVDAMHWMVRELKPRKFVFLEGNHEFRVTRYMRTGAPLVRANFKSLEEVFHLPKGAVVVPYGEYIALDGGLSLHHGIKTGRNNPNQMLDLLGTNIGYGHTHRLMSSSKRIHGGKIIRAFSFGWLGSFEEADYLDHSDWSHGFGSGLYSKSGKWSVDLHAIENGRCLAMGKEFTRMHRPGKR